ncbi:MULTISPECIES: sporulation/spore germination protein [unclassified Nodularia (in: cyanobacteria)]|uniref:sporulation/spore germination protein n=1 Tax=unclassified Nodularia (in: cyanobacteria) TaxID=2656917 RepID=UPI00187F4642|nr:MULTISPECIES: sporulation/spore germination protein [unclassified Nodularia (in: cyanobacteria)]MBE9201993.1 sporulation/spore germination protein [Nodularia sp. LEGE 06071]MCC2694279.1 sporulation/spore germination protein [Nodularia sp. LEGE 04288]
MTNKKYLLPFIVVAIAASISSCSPTSSTIESETPSSLTTPKATPKTPAATSQTPTSQTVKVILYTSDNQCQELIPQQVSIPAAEPISSAVGKIIAEQDTADFDLSGYRVQVQNSVATVDLRLSPLSKRQFVSLSSCEQFALFGSLRKTLMSNAEWNIKEVRFTEQGKEVIL